MKVFRYAVLMCALGFSAVACSGDASQTSEDGAVNNQEPTSEVSSQLVLRGINVPVVGTLEDGGVFQGTLTITQVALDSLGRVTAIGRLTGVGTDQAGTSMLVNQKLNAPLLLPQLPLGSCSIIDLDLGALHLDVLGLLVDLAPVHLDVTAQRGGSRLLGNLLCAIAGLLNPLPLP